jgi:transposase
MVSTYVLVDTSMLSNRSARRVHSAEFKTRILAECRQPGASVAAIAVAHGLNPNVVHKWRAGRGLKRMDSVAAEPAVRSAPALQFVPVELNKPERRDVDEQTSRPAIRIEFDRDGLQLKLRCAAGAGPSVAALLRALADAIGTA